MTTRPRLTTETNWVVGLAALVLFGVLSAVFVTASFGAPAGFPSDQSIVENIGYAMFNLDSLLGIPSEGFLVAFIVIAVALDAALDGSIMLAERDDEDDSTLPDGGKRPGQDRTDDGTRGDD